MRAHMLIKNGSRYKRSIYLIKSPTNFLFFNLGAFNGCVYFGKIPISVIYFTAIFVF